MEINLHPAEGPVAEFILKEEEVNILNSVLQKLAIEVENNKKLGYASKNRLIVSERDFFYDLSDKILAMTDYIDKNK